MSKLIFKFDKKDVDHLIQRELDLPHRIGKSFDYVYEKLKSLGQHLSFSGDISIPEEEYSDLIERGIFKKGKNYHWTSLDSGDVKIIIRAYRQHLTIFTRLERETGGKFSYNKKTYSCFEINTDSDIEYHLNEEGKSEIPEYNDFGEDFFYCKPFYDFNLLIGPIVKHIREDRLWLIWNPTSIPRPKRVDMKLYFDFKYSDKAIENIDKTIFAAEELSNIHSGLFSENEMLEKIRKLKVNDMLGAYKVTEIKSEVQNNYFHGVGLKILNTNFESESPKWADLYSLTSYYIENLFPSLEKA